MTMRTRLKEDNRGIALISVMICVMLSFLLSATIMRISLLSYLQKGIAKQASTTFYENESFVDDIKMGVQQKVAMAFANSSSKSQTTFLSNFKAALLADGTGDSEKEKLESALASYISNSNTLKVVSVSVDGEGGVLFKAEGEGEYVIKNVRIEYEDKTKDGYISKIKTDIRIKSPFYVTTTEPAGGGYSMVAANGAIITSGMEGRSSWGNLKQSGNLYFGYEKGTVTAVKVGSTDQYVVDKATAATIEYISYWMNGDNVIFNGDLYVTKNSCLIFTGQKLTVRGTIYLSGHSHLVLGSSSRVTCRDIVVDGQSVAGGAYSLGGQYTCTEDASKLQGDGFYTGFPVDFKGENKCRTGLNENEASSIALYSGNATAADDGTTTKLGSLSGKITLDATLKPVPNVKLDGTTITDKTTLEGTGEQYDKEMWGIIDVAYVKNAVTGDKNPKGYITSYSCDAADDKGHWTNFSGWESNTQEFPTIEGKTIGINVGSNIQTVNNQFGYFMVSWNTGEQKVGPLNINTGDSSPTKPIFYGMLFSTGKFNMVIRNTNLGYGVSFVEYYGGDVNKAKKVLKKIGKVVTNNSGYNGQYTDPNAASYYEAHNVNNMFRNGILSLLDQSGGGGQTTVSHDEVKNKSVEVVSFENWEKY